jgi:hypothetical protein
MLKVKIINIHLKIEMTETFQTGAKLNSVYRDPEVALMMMMVSLSFVEGDDATLTKYICAVSHNPIQIASTEKYISIYGELVIIST